MSRWLRYRCSFESRNVVPILRKWGKTNCGNDLRSVREWDHCRSRFTGAIPIKCSLKKKRNFLILRKMTEGQLRKWGNVSRSSTLGFESLTIHDTDDVTTRLRLAPLVLIHLNNYVRAILMIVSPGFIKVFCFCPTPEGQIKNGACHATGSSSKCSVRMTSCE